MYKLIIRESLVLLKWTCIKIIFIRRTLNMSRKQNYIRSYHRHNVNWGGGKTDLFIRMNEQGKFDLLDYQFDHRSLHKEFGGNIFHKSKSRDLGVGYLETLGDLIPVGFYRIDTRWPLCFPKEIGEEWELMIPYQKHQQHKEETLKKNPVVLRRGDRILFVQFNQLVYIVPKLLDGSFKGGINHYSDRCQIVTKRFAGKEFMFRFYDLFTYGEENFENKALAFMDHLIPTEAKVENLHRLNKLFRFIEDDGGIFETFQINGQVYKGDYLEESPLNNPDFLPSGWETLEKGVVYKRFGVNIKLVCWKEAFELAKEFPEILVPGEKQEDVFFSELDVPNILFQMNRAKYLEQARNEMLEDFKIFYSPVHSEEAGENEIEEIEEVVVE